MDANHTVLYASVFGVCVFVCVDGNVQTYLTSSMEGSVIIECKYVVFVYFCNGQSIRTISIYGRDAP